MITRSPISAWVIVAPAPIAQSRPMRTSGADHGIGADHGAGADLGARADHGAGIDGDAALQPRASDARCAPGATPPASNSEDGRSARETARARPSTKARRARARSARDTRRRQIRRQAPRRRGRRRRGSPRSRRHSCGCRGRRGRAAPARSSGAMSTMRRDRAAPPARGGAGQARDLAEREAARVLEEERLAHAAHAPCRRARPRSELRAAAEAEDLRAVADRSRDLRLRERIGESKRSGPSGESQIKPTPTEERIVVSNAVEADLQRFRRSTLQAGRALVVPQRAGVGEGRELDADFLRQEVERRLRPRRWRPSTCVPPSASLVVPSVRSRGPMPAGAKPRTRFGPIWK